MNNVDNVMFGTIQMCGRCGTYYSGYSHTCFQTCPNCQQVYWGLYHSCPNSPATWPPPSTGGTSTFTYYNPVLQLKQYEAFNKHIGCEPWPEEEQQVQAEVRGGFARAKQKMTLRGLKVVIGNSNYPVGSYVFVNGEHYIATWAQRVYEVSDSLKIILVPTDIIEFVRYYHYPAMTITSTYPVKEDK